MGQETSRVNPDTSGLFHAPRGGAFWRLYIHSRFDISNLFYPNWNAFQRMQIRRFKKK